MKKLYIGTVVCLIILFMASSANALSAKILTIKGDTIEIVDLKEIWRGWYKGYYGGPIVNIDYDKIKSIKMKGRDKEAENWILFELTMNNGAVAIFSQIGKSEIKGTTAFGLTKVKYADISEIHFQ